jgi:hypothetical protein
MGLKCPFLLQDKAEIMRWNQGFPPQTALKQKLGVSNLPKKLVVILPDFP